MQTLAAARALHMIDLTEISGLAWVVEALADPELWLMSLCASIGHSQADRAKGAISDI